MWDANWIKAAVVQGWWVYSCKSSTFFLRHPATADVHFTACGPPGKKFGHPCSRALKFLTIIERKAKN